MDLESISTDKAVRLLNDALTTYKRELKSQYQKHLDCIESELRDWLDSGSSNLTAVNFDSTISSFIKAKQFDGELPEIDREAISNMIQTAASKALDVENRLSRIEARLEQLEGMVNHHANIHEQTVSDPSPMNNNGLDESHAGVTGATSENAVVRPRTEDDTLLSTRALNGAQPLQYRNLSLPYGSTAGASSAVADEISLPIVGTTNLDNFHAPECAPTGRRRVDLSILKGMSFREFARRHKQREAKKRERARDNNKPLDGPVGVSNRDNVEQSARVTSNFSIAECSPLELLAWEQKAKDLPARIKQELEVDIERERTELYAIKSHSDSKQVYRFKNKEIIEQEGGENLDVAAPGKVAMNNLYGGDRDSSNCPTGISRASAIGKRVLSIDATRGCKDTVERPAKRSKYGCRRE